MQNSTKVIEEAQGIAYGRQTFLLPGFATRCGAEMLSAIHTIDQQAPFRHLVTPNGYEMSVAITNCGEMGWVSGTHEEYRYSNTNPITGAPWPAMPDVFLRIALESAELAGFSGFKPDSCIINRYRPGAKLGLHQDSDERDFTSPVVSISLGLPAMFMLGGDAYTDEVVRVRLEHGDVVVWGGQDRMRHHGIEPVAEGWHDLAGSFRYNLSIRLAQ